MRRTAAAQADTRVRALRAGDLAEVIRIGAAHSGREPVAYWQRVFDRFCGPGAAGDTVGLCAEDDGALLGYLFGEIRGVEFDSEPCGWVFAVAVDPRVLRGGIASALLCAAAARFRQLGVAKVRTLVARNDVPVLSFFRSHGFVGGPFAELELHLEPGVPRAGGAPR